MRLFILSVVFLSTLAVFVQATAPKAPTLEEQRQRIADLSEAFKKIMADRKARSKRSIQEVKPAAGHKSPLRTPSKKTFGDIINEKTPKERKEIFRNIFESRKKLAAANAVKGKIASEPAPKPLKKAADGVHHPAHPLVVVNRKSRSVPSAPVQRNPLIETVASTYQHGQLKQKTPAAAPSKDAVPVFPAKPVTPSTEQGSISGGIGWFLALFKTPSSDNGDSVPKSIDSALKSAPGSVANALKARK